MCRACLFNTVWRARHDTYDTCLLRASSNARKWCVRSLISSKQQCKCFVTNDSFIVFACYSSVIAKKNVIDAVQSEGIPNQIGSLRRKMTTIDDGHVGMWTRHARHVTWRAEWNLGLRQRTVEVCVCVCVCSLCSAVVEFHDSTNSHGSTAQLCRPVLHGQHQCIDCVFAAACFLHPRAVCAPTVGCQSRRLVRQLPCRAGVAFVVFCTTTPPTQLARVCLTPFSSLFYYY